MTGLHYLHRWTINIIHTFQHAVMFILWSILCWRNCCLSWVQKKTYLCPAFEVFTCRFVYQHRRWVAASTADTSDCCCIGSSLRTWKWPNLRCSISPCHFSGFILKFYYGIFIYFMHIDSSSVKFMFNTYFKQTEEFTYSARTLTCCPGFYLAGGCLRLRWECCHVNP